MIESELSNLSNQLLFQKMIDLVYQINKFVESEHQFVIDITDKILKHVKFIIKKYTHKSDEKLVVCYQCMRLKSQTSKLQFSADEAINKFIQHDR